MPDDPLEEWRAIQEAEWERIINNEQVYGWEHHTAERLEKENRLLAAWEKERAGGVRVWTDDTMLLQNAHRLQALRAEALKVAEEMERQAKDSYLDNDLPLYDMCVNGAARLRKACE